MTLFRNYCQCYECQTGFFSAEIGEHDARDAIFFPSPEDDAVERYYLENFITDDCSDDDDYKIDVYMDLTAEYYNTKDLDKKPKPQKNNGGVLRCDCGFFDDDIMIIY